MFKRVLTKFRNRKFYSKLIRENDLCFDIGANIGKKSKLFLSLGANVIAFEPQSSCQVELLKINNTKFSLYPIAVGNENGEQELFLANHSEVATLSNQFIDFYSSKEMQWTKNEKVKTKTLNSLIEEFGVPDFCKVDTEGYELNILSSLNYKIPIIEFEFTEGFFEDTLKIIELLKSKECSFNFTLNENPKFQLNNWVLAEELLEVMLNLPKKNLHGNIFVKTNVS